MVILPMPLENRRVAVTRPRHQAAEMCRLLEQAGADVLPIAVLEIQPASPGGALTRAIDRLNEFDWIVFTSANGVRYFLEAVQRAGGTIDGPRIAAVGAATAAALRQRALAADAMPDQFLAERLPDAMGSLAGSSILLPRGQLADDQLPQQLRGLGADTTPLVVYHTVPAGLNSEARRQLGQGVDAITFASGSAVQAFCHSMRGQLDELASRAVIACIGPSTAKVARDHQLAVQVIAQPHTARGLVDSLARYFQNTA